MARMIQCDKCKKLMYADSRSEKGDYCSIQIEYVDGHTSLHLCKICHRQLISEFLRIITPEEYDDEFGSWWDEKDEEQKKQEDAELHRGDEVAGSTKKAVVLNVNPCGSQTQVYDCDGKVEWWSKSAFVKTGKTHPEITAVLEKMREKDE